MIIFDKKRKRMKPFKLLLLGVTIALCQISCDDNRNHPGYSYFPDMEQSQAYETYTPNPVYADGKTNQLPPEYTIPREMIPYDFEKTPLNRTWAGEMIENPYAGDASVLEEGKRLFDMYCVNCHGDNGDGQGFLYTSKKYPYPPASLISDKIKDNPDGEIFHVISIGYGVMGAHDFQLLPDERWKITTYIRSVLHQQKRVGDESE